MMVTTWTSRAEIALRPKERPHLAPTVISRVEFLMNYSATSNSPLDDLADLIQTGYQKKYVKIVSCFVHHGGENAADNLRRLH